MKRWKLYVVPGSHFDLGWCSTPAEAFAYGDEIIRNGIDPMLSAHPDFRFTVEYARFMWHFLDTYPEYRDRVRKLIAEGRLALTALWSGMMDNILDGEAMIRNVVLARRWAKEALGAELAVAQSADCPGHARQLPQVLAKCGVKFLSHSRFGPPATVYRWRAPDGSSVLAVNHSLGLYPGIHKGWPDAGYGWAFTFLRDPAAARDAFLKQLGQTEQTATSDHLVMGMQSDLLMPEPRINQLLDKWREALPDFEFSTATIEGYFERVAAEDDKRKFPTFSGEMPYEFYSIPAFSAAVYQECRRAENALAAAEKFCSWQEVLGLGRYEPKGLDAAWEKLSYPHDHNVGGRHGEINDVVRLRKAQEARLSADEALEEAVISITTHIRYPRAETPLVIFNPLSWTRTDVVETYLEFWPKPVEGIVLHDAQGREAHVQILSLEKHGSFTRVTFLFVAENVPPMGYATYYATPLEKRPPGQPSRPMRVSVSGFENGFFKGVLSDGFIANLHTKSFGFEMVGAGAHRFNEVVALEDIAEDVDEKFTGKQWRASEHATHVEVVENGPVRGRIRVHGRLMNSTLEQDITFYAALPRLDLSTRIDWEGRRNTQVRIAMPFGVPRGALTYESPYAHVTMPDDEMPTTYRGTGGRFTGKWIDVSNGEIGVTLASRSGCHSLGGAAVYAVILRNAYSCGTPFLWYPQYGWHTFDFSLAAHAGDWRSPVCYESGWEFNNPLRVGRMCTARPIKPVAQRARLPESGSFCSLDQDGVIVSTIKKAYDGSGYVVRLVELTGEARLVRLRFGAEVGGAVETDLLERAGRGLESVGREVVVPVTAYGIHSVKVLLAGDGA